MTNRIKALLVHYLTATGAVLAMLAMLAAVDAKWDMMFLWLVVAFFLFLGSLRLAKRKTFSSER